eukprot:SAG22_NODE_2395_length_2620_cov_1.102737_3_plen_253_part_00
MTSSCKTGWAASRNARLEQWLADIDTAVTALSENGAPPPVLVGHSVGGAVAQVYAHAHQERLSGVGLLAALPVTSVSDSLRTLGHMAGVTAREHPASVLWGAVLGDGATAVAPSPAALRQVMGWQAPRSRPGLDEEEEAAVVHEHLLLERSASWVLLLEVLLRLHGRLIPGSRGSSVDADRRAALPTVVVGAEHDRLVSRDALVRMATTYGTEAVVVPDVGHCMMGRVGGDSDRAGRAVLQALRRVFIKYDR